MLKLISITWLVIGTAILPTTQAQGALRVSNINETPTGNGLVGSDSWIAQSFLITSAPNGYTLNTIDLLMNSLSGSPSNFQASIYSGPLGGVPQTLVGNLSGPSDPSVGGVYSYAASGITISEGQGYFVVVTSSTPVAQGAYDWSASDNFIRNGDWVINNQYATSSDGLTWQLSSRDDVFQLALYATPVPEPSTFALLGLGSLALVMVRRRE